MFFGVVFVVRLPLRPSAGVVTMVFGAAIFGRGVLLWLGRPDAFQVQPTSGFWPHHSRFRPVDRLVTAGLGLSLIVEP